MSLPLSPATDTTDEHSAVIGGVLHWLDLQEIDPVPEPPFPPYTHRALIRAASRRFPSGEPLLHALGVNQADAWTNLQKLIRLVRADKPAECSAFLALLDTLMSNPLPTPERTTLCNQCKD